LSGLLRLSRAIDTVNLAFGRFADWLVLAVIIVGAGTAGLRYLFNYGSNALLEIQWYFFGAIVLLGAAATLYRNEHVRVDIIYGMLSRRGRLIVDIVGLTLFLLPGAVFLAWLSWPVFAGAWASGETSSNYGGLVRWPILLALPLGFLLLALQGISELIKRVAALQGEAAETDYVRPTQ
jgi:TRAP-type mannitol/chloroaromatic compound transport system permease small subunit